MWDGCSQGMGRWSQVWQWPALCARGGEQSTARDHARLKEGASSPLSSGAGSRSEVRLWMWVSKAWPGAGVVTVASVSQQVCSAQRGVRDTGLQGWTCARHRHSCDAAALELRQPQPEAAPEGSRTGQPWPWAPPALSPGSPRNSPGELSLAPSTKPSWSRDTQGLRASQHVTGHEQGTALQPSDFLLFCKTASEVGLFCE